MTVGSIAVTGAVGAVGRRTVRQLAADQSVDRVVAIDRAPAVHSGPTVETKRVDVLVDDLAPLLAGVDSLVHLVDVDGRRDDRVVTRRLLDRVLSAAAAAGCPHVVVLSSALVYGAHPDNPIPLLESHPIRPNADLAYAMAKLELETAATAWAKEHRTALCIVRPTTTMSERGASWIARSLRAATLVRPEQIDPPVQFLHHDDLASALSLIARRRLGGIVNVAPDGWIGTEVFRELVGGLPVRMPAGVGSRVLEAGRRYGIRSTPTGIEPYVQYPWVVANDRLREAGWIPAFSNEEAFIAGTPAPPWAVSAQRRQEIALAVAGAGVAGAAAVAGVLARRLRP